MENSMREHASMVAEEITTNRESTRRMGPKNVIKNFTDMRRKFGNDGPAELYAALAECLCVHCPDSLRSVARVPDVLRLIRFDQHFRMALGKHLVPDSGIAQFYEMAGRDVSLISFEDTLDNLESRISTAFQYQKMVTAFQCGDLDLFVRLTRDYEKKSRSNIEYAMIPIEAAVPIYLADKKGK